MKYVLYLIPLILIACAKLPSPEPNQPFEHFSENFESGNLDQFHALVPNNENAEIISTIARKGSKSVKFYLRPGDITNNGNRTELGVYNCAGYQSEVYYGWSFMIDPTYTDPHFCLLAQWQNLPNYSQGEEWNNTFPSPPPVSLVYVDGQLQIKVNQKVVSEKIFVIGERSIQKGIWYDIVFRIFWSDQKDGYIEAWLNGSPMVDYPDNRFKGSNLYNRTGNYFKFGLYRGHDTDDYPPITSYCDELKIGSSYNEVKP